MTDALNQILLLCLLQFVGISFIVRFNISPRIFVWLGFIIGLIITIQILLISLYSYDYVNKEFIFGTIFVFIIANIYLNRNKLKLILNKSFVLDLLLLNLLLLFFVFVVKFFHFTGDSYQYYGISLAIFNNELTNEFITTFTWNLMNGRIIFLDSILILGYLFNIDIFMSLFPLISVVTVILIYRLALIKQKIDKFYILKVPALILVLLFTLSINMISFQATYLHSALLTGIFYSLGVIILFSFYDMKSNTVLNYLAFIFLAITILIRKEMLVFTMFPLIYYMIFSKYTLKEIYKYLFVFVLIGYQWAFYNVLNLEVINFKFSSPGLVLQYTICFIITLALPIIIMVIKYLLKRYNIRIASFLFLLYIFIFVVCLIVEYNETIDTIYKLFKFTFFNYKSWGLFWICLFISLISLLKSKFKAIVIHMIIAFITLRILLYIFIDSIWDYNSGNRVMFNLFFLGLYIIILALLQKGNFSHSQNYLFSLKRGSND